MADGPAAAAEQPQSSKVVIMVIVQPMTRGLIIGHPPKGINVMVTGGAFGKHLLIYSAQRLDGD